MIIKREQYLDRLRQLKGANIIKVVTGVRRCGKSTLLAQFRQELLDGGVSPDSIQSYNFEDPTMPTDYLTVYREIKGKLQPNAMNYIFLDEVQNIDQFQRLVDGLFIDDNVDLYVTGSNAYLLSGELATLLSGRYIEISMLPLSFGEYRQFDSNADLSMQFSQYMANGGFPQAHEMFAINDQVGRDYLRSIYDAVLIKDVVARDKINDVDMVGNILKFAANNIGNLVSPNKIANYIKSNYRSIDSRRVGDILQSFTRSYIVYPASRFNIKGKELLKTQQKYYLVDTGLRQTMVGSDSKESDAGHLLENIVYLELKRRGCEVWVGQNSDGGEVDFVTKDRRGEYAYYQVAYSVKDESTFRRELRPLQSISDNYPKMLLTTDWFEQDIRGIKVLNAMQWLIGDK